MTTSWAPFMKWSAVMEAPRRRSRAKIEPVELARPSTSSFRVTSTYQLGVATYELHGEIDTTTAAQVSGMLSAVHEEPVVLLDMGHVTTVDLEGVAVLREVILNVHDHGGRVAISRPSRLATVLLGLIDANGLVLVALTSAGAIAWLDEHRR
jgi:ABC-type transporter Mla MlaB component